MGPEQVPMSWTLTSRGHTQRRHKAQCVVPQMDMFATTIHDLTSSARQLGSGKVQLPLCLTKHHAMKTYWGSRGTALFILNLGTRWNWVVSEIVLNRAEVLGSHADNQTSSVRHCKQKSRAGLARPPSDKKAEVCPQDAPQGRPGWATATLFPNSFKLAASWGRTSQC